MKYTNPKRLWFTERKKLAIIEEVTNTTTVDGVSTNYKSIQAAKEVRIKGLALGTHFTLDSSGDRYHLQYDNNESTLLEDIPMQYHEALAYRVIAMGYREPRNLEIQLAQYFDLEYNNILKEAKKYARSNYQTTGTIVPRDF